MKCDELNPVTREYADEYWEDRFAIVYNADEVDAAIAELKAENRRLKHALWLSRAKAYRYIAELLTCFNPDYVRNRKMFTPNNLQQKQMNSLEWARLMLKVSNKCLKKAEEHK